MKFFIMLLSTISCYFMLAPNMSSVHCLRIFPLYVIPLIPKNKFHSNLSNKKSPAVFSSFIFFIIFFVGDCSVILISDVALLLKMSLSYVNTISDWSDVRVLTHVFLKFPCKVWQLVRPLCEA